MGIKEVNGKFVVSVYKRHPTTKVPMRMQKIVDSLRKAQIAEKELERALAKRYEEELQVLKGGKMKYRELLSRFYESLKDRDLANATVENYKLCLDAHTLNRWGNKAIDEILTDDIRKLIKVDLADKSKTHQKSMRKYINGVFTFAVEAGHIGRNPVPFMQFRLGSKLKTVLNETQANILLQNAKTYNHEWYPHWATAIYTGLRNEEQYALLWQNVDLENRRIYVRQVWTKKDGFKDVTKNGEDRVVEIAPPLLTIFKELKLKNSDSTFVLPRIQEWEDGRQAEILRMFLASLGLPQINYHGLRSSWATIMLGQGVPAVKVMKMGGWKNLKTLNDHYLRLAGVDIKGMTDNLLLHEPSEQAGELIQMPNRSQM
jgi:integrase